jgi:hypothetical protein
VNGSCDLSPAAVKSNLSRKDKAIATNEAAILSPLAPGAYTAIVRGHGSNTGVALVEAYNLP